MPRILMSCIFCMLETAIKIPGAMVSGQRTLKLEVLVLCYYFVGVPTIITTIHKAAGQPASSKDAPVCVYYLTHRIGVRTMQRKPSRSTRGYNIEMRLSLIISLVIRN